MGRWVEWKQEEDGSRLAMYAKAKTTLISYNGKSCQLEPDNHASFSFTLILYSAKRTLKCGLFSLAEGDWLIDCVLEGGKEGVQKMPLGSSFHRCLGALLGAPPPPRQRPISLLTAGIDLQHVAPYWSDDNMDFPPRTMVLWTRQTVDAYMKVHTYCRVSYNVIDIRDTLR